MVFATLALIRAVASAPAPTEVVATAVLVDAAVVVVSSPHPVTTAVVDSSNPSSKRVIRNSLPDLAMVILL